MTSYLTKEQRLKIKNQADPLTWLDDCVPAYKGKWKNMSICRTDGRCYHGRRVYDSEEAAIQGNKEFIIGCEEVIKSGGIPYLNTMEGFVLRYPDDIQATMQVPYNEGD